MYRKSDINLAEAIIVLDMIRDQLYEELMETLGMQAQELLRRLQNQ
jgi:hypothetical protein